MAYDKKEGLSPFDYAKAILNGDKKPPFSKSYLPYIVNRTVAHHRDNLLLCQFLNELELPPEHHYDFLFYKIPKRQRSFEKWIPVNKGPVDQEDVNLVADYYKCSSEKAREYLPFLKEGFITLLQTKNGGRENRPSQSEDAK